MRDAVGFVAIVVLPCAVAISLALGVASQVTTPGHWAGGVLGLAAGLFAVSWLRWMLRA